MNKKIEFLIIDPQNDFCTTGLSDDEIRRISKVNPSLANYLMKQRRTLVVPGAYEDMERLAGVIKRLKNIIDDIHVTLDTHHYIDIAAPCFLEKCK